MVGQLGHGMAWYGMVGELGLMVMLTDAPRVDLEPVERLPHPQNIARLRLRPEVVGSEGPVVHLGEEGEQRKKDNKKNLSF